MGAKALLISASVEGAPYSHFSALVYAKFNGDYKKVVKALRLKKADENDLAATGEFTRKLEADVL